jgi:hypothetical protein
MRPFILIAVLFAALLFTAPAQASCSGGLCLLPGQPVARLASAVRNRQVRPVARLVAARTVRTMFASRQPVRRALRGVGSLFVR